MKYLGHIWFIAQKDIKLFVTDRMALFFFVLFPFLFVTLFSVVLGGIGSEDERLELHLVTEEDRGGISRQIIKAVETDDVAELDPGEPNITWSDDYDEAYLSVMDEERAGFVVFPEDFTDGVSMGYGTTIEVVADPDDTYTRAALNAMAEGIGSNIGMQQVVSSAITELLLDQWIESPDSIARMGENIPEILSIQRGVRMRPSLIEYDVEKVGKVEAENPSDFVIPGYLVMFVFMAAAFSAETIVRERQNRTLERLLATSVKRESIIAGLFAGTAAKGLVQITIFWTMGILVFNMNLGRSLEAVLLLSVLMVVMSSAFAIMLATMARTQRSAGSIALITSLLLAPLGGCWWAKITPHGWATTGFNKLLVFGGDFNAVTGEMLALMVFAAIFGIIAIWRFRASAV
jgi:ABC-2 type transport system permease protein